MAQPLVLMFLLLFKELIFIFSCGYQQQLQYRHRMANSFAVSCFLYQNQKHINFVVSLASGHFSFRFFLSSILSSYTANTINPLVKKEGIVGKWLHVTGEFRLKRHLRTINAFYED